MGLGDGLSPPLGWGAQTPTLLLRLTCPLQGGANGMDGWPGLQPPFRRPELLRHLHRANSAPPLSITDGAITSFANPGDLDNKRSNLRISDEQAALFRRARS